MVALGVVLDVASVGVEGGRVVAGLVGGDLGAVCLGNLDEELIKVQVTCRCINAVGVKDQKEKMRVKLI